MQDRKRFIQQVISQIHTDSKNGILERKSTQPGM